MGGGGLMSSDDGHRDREKNLYLSRGLSLPPVLLRGGTMRLELRSEMVDFGRFCQAFINREMYHTDRVRPNLAQNVLKTDRS